MGLRILEAGCGRRCQSDTPRDAHVVGLDIDEAGLALNDRLDERIVADIESADLPRDAFDRIVCHDVLEHLPRPIVALDNLVGSLAPGGELRLGLPNVASRKSLVAKFTPHSFHVLVYRMLGRENAGRPGYAPFPTYLRWSLRQAALERWAQDRGLDILESRKESGGAFNGRPVLRRLVGSASELRLVLRKPGGPWGSGS
jgi:2-polyprenyl-3-methyl-5-hydroxy-6-metoxy-1,4-benzoquinol methylase